MPREEKEGRKEVVNVGIKFCPVYSPVLEEGFAKGDLSGNSDTGSTGGMLLEVSWRSDCGAHARNACQAMEVTSLRR